MQVNLTESKGPTEAPPRETLPARELNLALELAQKIGPHKDRLVTQARDVIASQAEERFYHWQGHIPASVEYGRQIVDLIDFSGIGWLDSGEEASQLQTLIEVLMEWHDAIQGPQSDFSPEAASAEKLLAAIAQNDIPLEELEENLVRRSILATKVDKEQAAQGVIEQGADQDLIPAIVCAADLGFLALGDFKSYLKLTLRHGVEIGELNLADFNLTAQEIDEAWENSLIEQSQVESYQDFARKEMQDEKRYSLEKFLAELTKAGLEKRVIDYLQTQLPILDNYHYPEPLPNSVRIMLEQKKVSRYQHLENLLAGVTQQELEEPQQELEAIPVA